MHLHRVRRVAHVNDLEAPRVGGDEHQVSGHGHILRRPGGIDLADDGQKLHGRHLRQGRRRHLDHQVRLTLARLQAKARLALRIGHGSWRRRGRPRRPGAGWR